MEEKGICDSSSSIHQTASSCFDSNQFGASEELSDNNTAIVEQLDQLQLQVERLRTSAYKLEEQRDELTKSLTDMSELTGSAALSEGLFNNI